MRREAESGSSRTEKTSMVQTDVDVALSIELYIWNANLSLYTIYVIYVYICDMMGYFIFITSMSLWII